MGANGCLGQVLHGARVSKVVVTIRKHPFSGDVPGEVREPVNCSYTPGYSLAPEIAGKLLSLPTVDHVRENSLPVGRLGAQRQVDDTSRFNAQGPSSTVCKFCS